MNLFYLQAVPKYLSTVQGNIINTKYETVNNVLIVYLSSGIFIGGFIGFILDNTIPGIVRLYYDVFIFIHALELSNTHGQKLGGR